ncbi:hypothetical protein GPJ56_009572 [Histomonas meleagridis]|uniref:uncharacterized protein n=1 Tax=Histomonas meleagridis TaxID=135588 RepID=UPI00355ACD65|nr:hypothetical protein GPJ56_009572 [Histomonas meleagridis]KAH0799662.1 hypothetical protein GO595_007576 [Histomonas meleagridis]
MSSIYRREYKRKDKDIALEEASAVINDLDNWESEWPTFIEKLYSERSELRLSAMQSMNKTLTARFIGEDILPFLNDTVTALIGPITNPVSKAEHDEALGVICNLALNTFEEFETFTNTILNELMPNLKNIAEEQSFRFFSIAFITSFTMSHHDVCIKVFNRFTDFIIKKKSPNFTPAMIADCINAIELLVSSLPSDVVATELLPNLKSILETAFSVQKHKIILAAIPLFGVVYEALIDYENGVESEDESASSSKTFLFDFRPRLANLSKNIAKKEHKKTIGNEANAVISSIEDEIDEELVLANQTVHILGRRNNVKLSAIRRITKVHFLQQMTQNTKIHEMFGFQLMSHAQALRIKKKYKGDIQRERTMNAKEREREIAKKRKKKDMKEGMFNHEDY